MLGLSFGLPKPLPTGANVIRKFTSNVAGQNYQFDLQCYGEDLLGGGEEKKSRITEKIKDAHSSGSRQTGHSVQLKVS
jgi:hypothetical protein